MQEKSTGGMFQGESQPYGPLLKKTLVELVINELKSKGREIYQSSIEAVLQAKCKDLNLAPTEEQWLELVEKICSICGIE